MSRIRRSFFPENPSTPGYDNGLLAIYTAMIYCCDNMDTGFHFPRVSTFPDAARGNGGSSKSGVQMRFYSVLDVRLGRSTVSTSGIGKGRDPGGMKASVHVVITVWHIRGGGVKAVVYRDVFEHPPSCAAGLNLS